MQLAFTLTTKGIFQRCNRKCDRWLSFASSRTNIYTTAQCDAVCLERKSLSFLLSFGEFKFYNYFLFGFKHTAALTKEKKKKYRILVIGWKYDDSVQYEKKRTIENATVLFRIGSSFFRLLSRSLPHFFMKLFGLVTTT